MDCLVSIPVRVSVEVDGEKQLTPISTDVFVSIPGRDSTYQINGSLRLYPVYQSLLSLDLFN